MRNSPIIKISSNSSLLCALLILLTSPASADIKFQEGTVILAGPEGDGPGQFYHNVEENTFPWDFAVDSEGRIWILDRFRVQLFDSDARFLGQFNVKEKAPRDYAEAIEVDRNDYLYILVNCTRPGPIFCNSITILDKEAGLKESFGLPLNDEKWPYDVREPVKDRKWKQAVSALCLSSGDLVIPWTVDAAIVLKKERIIAVLPNVVQLFGSPFRNEVLSIEEHRWRFEPIFLKRYNVSPVGFDSGVAVDIDAEYTAFSPDSLAAIKERKINVPGTRVREVKAIDPSGNIFIHSYIYPDYSRLQLKPGEYFGYEDEKIEVYDRDGKLCGMISDGPKRRMGQAIHYYDFTTDAQGNFYQLQAVNPRVNPGEFIRIWKWERIAG